jgi:hypothetical protein
MTRESYAIHPDQIEYLQGTILTRWGRVAWAMIDQDHATLVADENEGDGQPNNGQPRFVTINGVRYFARAEMEYSGAEWQYQVGAGNLSRVGSFDEPTLNARRAWRHTVEEVFHPTYAERLEAQKRSYWVKREQRMRKIADLEGQIRHEAQEIEGLNEQINKIIDRQSANPLLHKALEPATA